MAASSRGVLASTSHLACRIACHSNATASTSAAALPSSSFRRLSTRTRGVCVCSHPRCQSRTLHTSSAWRQEAESSTEDPAPPKGGGREEKPSSSQYDDSWAHRIYDAGDLAAIRGKGARPGSPTLEEFRALRPSPHSVRVGSHFAEHLRPKLKAERLWDLAYEGLNNSYNVDQLIDIAKLLNLPIVKKGTARKPRKAALLTLLIKHDFKFSNPREKPQLPAPATYFIKTLPVSRTALFLMLVDSGRLLAQISSSHPGVDLRPELKMEAKDGQEPEPVFYLAASAREKSLIEEGIEATVEDFVSTIRSRLYTLDMPAEALDSEVVQHISQQTRCAINLEPSPPPSSPLSPVPRPRLRLAATSWDDVANAETQLSAMQGRYFQPMSSLMSYAAPSPLDPAFQEDLDADRTIYGFLPTIPHSSVLWSLRSTLGDRSSSSFFRLARVRRAAWAQYSTEQIDQMSLVDLENATEDLDTSRSWKTLDEKLSWTGATALDRLSSSATATRDSLHIGQLLYQGRSNLQDIAGPENQVLQQVFGAPLSGAWTLDSAYAWFSQQRGQDASSPHPLWTPTQLDGSAVDAVGEHGPQLKMWLERTPAVEEEKIRLVYWAHPESAAMSSTEAVRLEIDVREEEGVASPAATEQVDEADPLSDLLGNANSDGGNTGSAAMKFTYVVDSARWVTVKQADLFAPDHLIDLRARSRRTCEVDPTQLEALAPLQEYLTRLTDSVGAALNPSPPSSPPKKEPKAETEEAKATAPAPGVRWTLDAEDAETEQEPHQPQHPKTLRPPVPLGSSPPLAFALDGMACRFESAERVFTSRWEVDTMFGENLYAELYGKEGKQKETDDITGTEHAQSTYFINETTIGGETGDAGRTCSRIEWSPAEEGGKEEDSGSIWAKRVHSVRGLFKKLVIGQLA